MLRRVSSPRFVGRADELAALDAALARAVVGTPAFAFVAGESGVGKSRLVAELEGRAAAGARVLVGRCLELGDTVFPYAPLVDALRPVARDGGADLPPASRAALAELLPELGEPAAAADVESAARKAGLLEALLALLDRLAREQPLLLVIEDLHWADPSTRDFLVYLIRSARSERLCLVATYRSDELHRRHPLRPVLSELERAAGAERIALERFDRAEVADQLAGILDEAPDPALADRLYERGGGNALFTEELLAASAAGLRELPETLRDVLLARVERLPAAAQEVVRIAAVVERPVRHGLLEAVSRLAPADVMAGAREAVAHQVLVTARDETYAFRHALVGEAVYGDLLPGERTALHAAVGEAIERDSALLGDVEPARVAADLACHWRGALDLPRALGAAVQAGLAARRMSAHSEALRHFESALETWERVPDAEERAGTTRSELLRAAAAMAADGFLPSRAVALQREALAAGEAADPRQRARLYAELADYLRGAGKHDEGDEAIAAALAALPGDAELERARLRERGAKSLMLRGYIREAAAEAAAAADVARRLGDVALETRALITQGYAYATLGHVDEGIRLLHTARDLAPVHQERVRAVVHISEVLDLSGRTEQALAEVRAEIPLASERPEPTSFDAFLELQEAMHLLRLGRTAEAARRLPDRLPGDPINDTAMYLHALRAEIAVRRGDNDAAQAAIDHLQRQLAGTRDVIWIETLAHATTLLAVREGRLEDGRAAVDRALALVEDSDEGGRRLRLLWLGMMVEAEAAQRAQALGVPFDDERGRTLAARLDGAIERRGQWAEGPRYALLARAEQARLAHTLGLAPPDPTVWLAAAAGFDELSLPSPAAYARLRAAEAHVAAGDRAAAGEPLAAALAAATAIEAAPLADAAGALARAARIRIEEPGAPAAAPPAAPFGLTPREREVLALVAEGRTNREIGEALFMSEKTASVHVSRILAKLDVGGRVEAAAVAHRLGLADVVE